MLDGELVLADEVLTPTRRGSGRPTAGSPARTPAVVRQAAGARLARGVRLGQDAAAARRCSAATVAATRARYVEAYERLSGRARAWPVRSDVGRRVPGVEVALHGAVTFDVLVEVRAAPRHRRPAGRHHRAALPTLGFAGVAGVRVGKAIRFSIDATDEASARAEVDEPVRAVPHQSGHRGRRRSRVEPSA